MDEWRKYDPKNPPYRYVKDRTKSQTMRLTGTLFVLSCLGGWAFASYLVKIRQENHDRLFELEKKGAYTRSPERQAVDERWWSDLMRDRRKRLGLSARPYAIEINDKDGRKY
eukprot:GHVL01006286.1.p1 GENE.GHVL01006286.1~~GHVL01006286.1.p1  ORF type:complete len:112 (-),score=17.86 GHVL01006286.1:350-685(-)